jgi:hypothetical protein
VLGTCLNLYYIVHLSKFVLDCTKTELYSEVIKV